MNYSLSDRDLRTMFPNTPIVTYPQLAHYQSLDQILGSDGSVIILFLSDEHYGHWTCLFTYPDHLTVEFFDSYGSSPRAEWGFIPQAIRQRLHENAPYLNQLLKRSLYHVVDFPYDLQSHGDDVCTCGDHVACRLLNREFTARQYYDRIMACCQQTGMNPDQLVVHLVQKPF